MTRVIVTISCFILLMLIALSQTAPHGHRGERQATPLLMLELLEEMIMKEACNHRRDPHVRPGK
ncbi:hypothetical protein PRIPAC_95999 [Pristionchus pacificus]|uniref:Uncharacterized protein n=1 Tax=Pristionchus pacificus TaxID=54126 RepID=A0A2A6BD37_PRIPA|nr:hypothetical protein PRIPAC_95999 [Pristionchus pacificus]|eukprot:PDM63803.1 hypothetical protein PRIPAC_49776 [Pristionchus pacificus]